MVRSQPSGERNLGFFLVAEGACELPCCIDTVYSGR